MAYTITWDASTPDGAITPAADIDQEIQDLKASLGERLVQIMPEWAGVADPKKIAIVVDVIANRPATPDFQGEMFFATDTQTLYIADATPEWKSTGGIAVEEGDDTATSVSLSGLYQLASAYNSPADDTWRKVGGWTSITDNAGFYSGILPLRFLIPAAGDYMFNASLTVGSGGASASSFAVTLDGATPTSSHAISANNEQTSISLNRLFHGLTTANYVEFWMKAFGGAAPWLYTPTHVVIHRLT